MTLETAKKEVVGVPASHLLRRRLPLEGGDEDQQAPRHDEVESNRVTCHRQGFGVWSIVSIV